MKYCEIDGLRYPDSLSDCTACGARLVSFDSSPDFLTTPQVVATSCCPNPLCRALVAPPQANFCALCAHRLKPISFDIWVNKVAEPALRGNPVEVLLDPTGVLRPAAELGLPLEEAEAYLEQELEQRTGLDRVAFGRLRAETLALLEDGREDIEAAKERAIERALEQMPASYAVRFVERLALEVVDGGTSRARPGAAPSQSELQLPGPEPTAPVETETAEAQSADGDAAAYIPPTIIRRSKDESREDEGRARLSTAAPETPSGVGGGRSQSGTHRTARSKRTPPAPKSSVHNTRRLRWQGPWAFVLKAIFLAYILFLAMGVPYLIWRHARSPASRQAEVGHLRGGGDASTATQKAVLTVYSDVDDVSLWVDDVQSGVLALGQLRSLRLSPGTHVVRAVRPRYQSWERRVDLGAGARLLLPVVLLDQAGSPQNGSAGMRQRSPGARLLQMGTPVYPAGAESMGAVTVWVAATIDERGNVSTARIVRGPARLQRAAIDAVRLSRFRPAQRDGQLDSDRQVLPVVFNPAR
jgi:TonB family protein